MKTPSIWLLSYAIAYSVPFALNQSLVAQTQNMTDFPIALPERITLKFKPGGTLSGVRLTAINPQKKQLQIQQGGISEWRNIASIDRITFKGKTILRDGEIVIRGEGNRCSNPDTWNLPLNYLRIINSRQATVNLSSLPKNRQNEIRQISSPQTYVVDEMQFSSPNQVTLKTVPCR